MKLVTFFSLKWAGNTFVSSYFLFKISTPVKSESHLMIYSCFESLNYINPLLQVFLRVFE
jgi:hypothetical protein